MLPIDDGAPEATCAFAVHIIHRKSDGTNSSIWRRSKLFVMEVTSWFLPSGRLGNCSTPALLAIPDILPMHGCTAVDTYQPQNKQMRSIGVLTEREAATEVLQEPLATRSLRIFLDTDHSASAQIKAWQLHCGECEDNLHVWSCRSPCWKHQYHLDRKDAYVHADWLQRRLFHSVGGFFATLAKWMNLWRCFFAKISRSWGFARDQETHEVATARRRSKATWCKRTPEKCLAGRWGSAEACMDRIPDDDQNFFFILDVFAEARAHLTATTWTLLPRNPRCERFERIGGPRKACV